MHKIFLKFLLAFLPIGLVISCTESDAYNAKIKSGVLLNETIKLSPTVVRKSEVLNDFTQLELMPSNYSQWMKSPENNLLQEKVMEKIKYQMILVPNDYLLLKKFGYEIDKSQLLKKEKPCNTQFIFRVSGENQILDLSTTGIKNQREFNERIKYLAFKIQKDIYLESDSKDKISCQVSTYERDYSLAPYATFTLQFPVCEKELGQYRLVYSDQLFNHGNIKFHWNKETIKNIPKLISNE